MRIVPAALPLVLAALVLSGCSQPPPRVVPTSTPTFAPIFATDAEALAAARVAYDEYIAMSDTIGDEGGRSPERIAPFVTKAWLPHELRDSKELIVDGQRLTGSSRVTYLKYQSREQSAAGLASVHVYDCLDVSRSRLLDSNGHDITPKSRVDVSPSVTNFRSAVAGSAKLLFAGSTPWPGKNYCA